jgi:hypothetical protein
MLSADLIWLFQVLPGKKSSRAERTGDHLCHQCGHLVQSANVAQTTKSVRCCLSI